MKTATITLHDTENCGSSLQAFALQHYLIEHGIENELIDYIPKYTQNGGHIIRTFARKVVYFDATIRQRKKFRNFISEHLVLTKKKYLTLKQLKQDPPAADCYITGSDQLWNTMYACGHDPAFYLDFAEGKKIAYAVSLGREIIPEDNLDTVRKFVGNFSAISVRENSSVEQLEKLYNNKIAYVCDPVLLNPVSAYDPIKVKRMIHEPYILVYIAQGIEPEVLNNWINKVNMDKKRAVVFIGSYRQKCRSDYHIRETSPGEFLSLIYYSDYILSNSFHATMFSLMYNKQFATIIPSENGARMRSILSDVGLENHAVTPMDILPEDISTEQYVNVQKALDKFRSNSQKWLMSVLSVNTK